MQLYAKTAPNTTKKETLTSYISAERAERQRDYFCAECSSIVRLRAGQERVKHFYHLGQTFSCRQHAKSLEHIHTQLFIQEQIGLERCLLEVAFPEIQRIADVVWEEEKLVFEVQCSPMTALEARSRIADYAKAGYETIFILHDKRFNQTRLSALEFALRQHAYYFSNISTSGFGILYDQFDQIKRGRRVKRLAKLPIQIDKPDRFCFKESSEMRPAYNKLKERYGKISEQTSGLLYFQDDLFSLAQTKPDSPYIMEALRIYDHDKALDQMLSPVVNGFKREKLHHMIIQAVQQFLSILWRHLLEKGCCK